MPLKESFLLPEPQRVSALPRKKSKRGAKGSEGTKQRAGREQRSELVPATEILTDKELRFSSVQAKALGRSPEAVLAVLVHLLPPSANLPRAE